ncbi:Dihydrolipoamide acyltransferase [Frankia canadensis]|uniref:Dihydrolipoamide acyltransferase n=1 Tax=Frankia canadensis TaxID=1836972 RepID=A0A2I2KJF2_9ACTN|nr:lipoyl domain-containing protein [Frankia canadensis]SNQ45801.1 Dihydrolipoamide acyltransferase [Frankia canadensis]SOU53091.1 Dihydrolipoamide acyltransferase [Frankia canadensis]
MSENVEAIRIPKTGVSVTEGAITEWLVSDGDTVEAGAPIYVLGTDKVENEIDAPVGGRIRVLVEADADEAHPVGTLIAEIIQG